MDPPLYYLKKLSVDKHSSLFCSRFIDKEKKVSMLTPEELEHTQFWEHLTTSALKCARERSVMLNNQTRPGQARPDQT
jgi:hypothetical protein